jgi:Pyrimidine dimer DNA glycosylase
MRLWSLHPSTLDRMGLLAVWREGLLAQKVLLGETKGYRFHPQLDRFRASGNPTAAIGTYLSAVLDEATNRGYQFDASKIVTRRLPLSITVTRGQLDFERQHLMKKLQIRDHARFRVLRSAAARPHPMLRVVTGGREPWESA